MMLFKFVDDTLSQHQQTFKSLVSKNLVTTHLSSTSQRPKSFAVGGENIITSLPTAQYLGSTKIACSVLPFLFTAHWLCVQKSTTAPPPAEESQDFSCQQWHFNTGLPRICWVHSHLQHFILVQLTHHRKHKTNLYCITNQARIWTVQPFSDQKSPPDLGGSVSLPPPLLPVSAISVPLAQKNIDNKSSLPTAITTLNNIKYCTFKCFCQLQFWLSPFLCYKCELLTRRISDTVRTDNTV